MGRSVVVDHMRALPAGIRAHLRDSFTLGPDLPLGMWQWTLMDGSTYAAVSYDDFMLRPSTTRGWAGLSLELDLKPVIGVYVDPDYRGQGVATQLVSSLMTTLVARRVVRPGNTIFAVTSRWPRYEAVLESLGFECEEWA